MHDQMLPETVSLMKRLPTNLTRKCLVFVMNPLVTLQLFVFGEGLAALIANIRALVSMKLVVYI